MPLELRGVSDGSPRTEACLTQVCQPCHPSRGPGAKIHVLCQRPIQHPELASTGVQFVYSLPENGRQLFRASRWGDTQQGSIFPGTSLEAGVRVNYKEGKGGGDSEGILSTVGFCLFSAITASLPWPRLRCSGQYQFE